MKSITIAIAAAFILTLTGLSSQAQTADAQIKQWRGLDGDVSKHNDAITSQQKWAKQWQHLNIKTPVELNEKTETAVFIFIGESPNTGYKPYIISAVEKDGQIVVTYSKGESITRDYEAKEITHPWVAAIIPNKKQLPVVIKQL